MSTISQKLQYYLGTTYRRKKLDKHLNSNRHYFKGKVLDIGGGRKRGAFIPPKTKEWIFADISPELKPDVICNVENMKFNDNIFNTIKATELFEHVQKPEQGIKECYRVLKKNGYLIVSMPFLYPIHGDPYDYQRWTKHKWKTIAKQTNFKVEKIITIGYFFTVLSDMLKKMNRSLPLPVRLLGYAFYPVLDIVSAIDNLKIISKNKILKTYTSGYLIILKK